MSDEKTVNSKIFDEGKTTNEQNNKETQNEINGYTNKDNNRIEENTKRQCNIESDLEEQRQLKRKIFMTLIVVNVVAFFSSFSYWIQSGVLPYLTRKLGVNAQVFGYMQSTFALYQLIGSPIFGRFGDVFGCRLVLAVSEFASSIAYGSLAFASNIEMLFLSRVPAFAMHSLQGSYMIITDVTLPSDRANMLGKLGVSHGIGMLRHKFMFSWLIHPNFIG